MRSPSAIGIRILAAIGLSAALLAGCARSPAAPEIRHDLTGRWRGTAHIPTTGLPTPLEMTLVDRGGQVTGTGGGVDCRYYITCGSFYSYTVAGSHSSSVLRLTGETPEGRSWTLLGALDRTGSRMSGTISGADFPPSAWQMDKQR